MGRVIETGGGSHVMQGCYSYCKECQYFAKLLKHLDYHEHTLDLLNNIEVCTARNKYFCGV